MRWGDDPARSQIDAAPSERNPFGGQQRSFQRRVPTVAADAAAGGNHAMAGHALQAGATQDVADHPRRARTAGEPGDRAVCGDAPVRDPAFYRLDLRVEKRWTLQKARWISFVAETLNTTLHKEIVSNVELGPIAIPSVGVEGGF